MIFPFLLLLRERLLFVRVNVLQHTHIHTALVHFIIFIKINEMLKTSTGRNIYFTAKIALKTSQRKRMLIFKTIIKLLEIQTEERNASARERERERENFYQANIEQYIISKMHVEHTHGVAVLLLIGHYHRSSVIN